MLNRYRKGFTFIELILVVAIISIITILSSAFYSRFLIQNATINASDQITGSLRKAQTYSLMGKQGSSWGVNIYSNTITLFKGNTFLGRDDVFDENFSLNPNIIITEWNDIIFTKTSGLPAPVSLSVTISGNNITRTINMNSQGIISNN